MDLLAAIKREERKLDIFLGTQGWPLSSKLDNSWVESFSLFNIEHPLNFIYAATRIGK
jgi:hypothetical protein